jgi:hypothetical protein
MISYEWSTITCEFCGKEVEISSKSVKTKILNHFSFYRLLDINQMFLPGDRPLPFNTKPVDKDIMCAEALNWQFAPVYSRLAIHQLYPTIDDFRKVKFYINS